MGYETNRDHSNAMKKTTHPSWEYRGGVFGYRNKPVIADGFGLIPSGEDPEFRAGLILCEHSQSSHKNSFGMSQFLGVKIEGPILKFTCELFSHPPS